MFPWIGFEVVEFTNIFAVIAVKFPFVVTIHSSMSLVGIIDCAEEFATDEIAMILEGFPPEHGVEGFTLDKTWDR